MNKIRAWAALFVVLVLLASAQAQPAKRAVDITVNCYNELVSVVHALYDLAIRALKMVVRIMLMPRTMVTEFFGFTIAYAVAKVATVLVQDLFVILGLFVRGLGAVAGLCLSCPVGITVVINFLLSNVIYLLSVFLVSVSSFMPEILSAYVHDFVFNFVEGFNDPWPTFMAIWPDIEYYMDILEPVTSLSGLMENATGSLGALGSLLTLPLDLVINCAGGILNAIMYTKLGTGLRA